MKHSRCFRLLLSLCSCLVASHVLFASPGCGAIDLGAVAGKDACTFFNCDAFFFAAPTDDHDDMDDMDDHDDMDDMGDMGDMGDTDEHQH